MFVSAALILDENHHILMAKRKLDGQCPGMWECPGGKVQRLEAPDEAVERELEEELGIRAYTLELVSSVDLNFGTPFTFLAYHTKIAEGTPTPLVGQLDVQYIDLDHAVAQLPCCPSTYVCYAEIKKFLIRMS